MTAFSLFGHCTNFSEDLFGIAEKFVISLYDRNSSLSCVNELRFVLVKKGVMFDKLPPCKDALRLHVKRACLTSDIWNQSLITLQVQPDPVEWGFALENGNYVPVWSLLPPAETMAETFTKCSCKDKCSKRCSCKKAGLVCTSMCKCDFNSCNLPHRPCLLVMPIVTPYKNCPKLQ